MVANVLMFVTIIDFLFVLSEKQTKETSCLNHLITTFMS